MGLNQVLDLAQETYFVSKKLIFISTLKVTWSTFFFFWSSACFSGYLVRRYTGKRLLLMWEQSHEYKETVKAPQSISTKEATFYN